MKNSRGSANSRSDMSWHVLLLMVGLGFIALLIGYRSPAINQRGGGQGTTSAAAGTSQPALSLDAATWEERLATATEVARLGAAGDGLQAEEIATSTADGAASLPSQPVVAPRPLTQAEITMEENSVAAAAQLGL